MKKIVFVSILILMSITYTRTQSAIEIIKKSEEKMRGTTSYSEITMKIIRPKWEREIAMKVWSMGTEYTLIYIMEPVKEKGNVILKRGLEVWNWVPNIERIVKLPPSMMMQSWMGSDFTNDGLVKESSIVTDYEHLLGKDTIIEKRECFQIVLMPKPDAPVVWGKIYTWIDKVDYIQVRSEFFDEDGYLVNIMTGTDIKVLGGKTVATKLEMIPAKNPKKKTILMYNKLQFDEPMDESFFTIQNMKMLK